MKKRILLLAALAICTAITVSGTLAYYTAEDKVHNVITSTGVNIDIVEKTKGENGVLIDFPEEGIHGVTPGTSVSKIVQVQNTGSAEAWIRVKVESAITDANGKSMPLIVDENNIPVMTYSVLKGWVEGSDGYWYYNKPVAPNAFTDILFEEVRFEPTMGNEYQNCTANIIISAQAVQTANNPIPDGEDVTDIKGWPAE